MRYEQLSSRQFDAVATGEATHLATWFEDELVELICDYFVGRTARRKDMTRLVFRRDGLNFQHKIEIVRAMIPLLVTRIPKASGLKSMLTKIENFKAFRNALVHGVSASPREGHRFTVELIDRAGREKQIEVDPSNFRKRMKEADVVLKELQQLRRDLKGLTQRQHGPAKTALRAARAGR